jgi:hypothetical protein
VKLTAEEVVGEEWAEWYRLSPAERFRESMKLWDTYLALGGSLEPEPDTQSPFFEPEEWRGYMEVQVATIGLTHEPVMRRVQCQ